LHRTRPCRPCRPRRAGGERRRDSGAPMNREDLEAARDFQDAAHGEQEGAIDEGPGGPSLELVASTVEALRARIDDEHREGLRGTIDGRSARAAMFPEHSTE
jgi:hypothetical protein